MTRSGPQVEVVVHDFGGMQMYIIQILLIQWVDHEGVQLWPMESVL